jgi:PAS domain S-box-containing protein
MNDPALSGPIFRQLAEAAPDALAVHRKGVVLWANAAASDLLEAGTAAALVGHHVADFIPPEERGSFVAAMSASLASQRPVVYVSKVKTLRGRILEVEVTRTPIGDDLALVVVRSLEHERQQRAAEVRARAFFDASTAALGISRLGVHVEANLAYARLFGFDDPARLVGTPIFDLIDPSEHERIRDKVRRRGAGEEEEPEYDVLARRQDGSPFMMGVKVSSYVDGADTFTIVVASDVTAERAEAAGRAHRERLESIGRLAGGVAHDFNNLLGAILANVDLSLLEAAGGTPMHEHLTTIRDATRRAKDLVRQILTFGRRDQPRPVPIDPAQVVGEALTLARAGLPPGMELTASLPPIAGSVLADPTQLHQIVLNLVSNACDAVAPKGHVEVSVSAVDGASLRPTQPGSWVCLRVRDDGVGMTEETRRHLFEPYHTTKGGRGGHGLGLAVVQGIVTSLNGRIDVTSAPQRGATFDVFLPLSGAPSTTRFTPAPAQAGHGRVLVVDDEPMLLRSMGTLLRSLGYEVLEAPGGAQALELLAREKVDLLLSDVTMPGLSGLELAREVALKYPTVRILLSSGYSDGLDNVPPGVMAVLPKPLGRKELALALSTALREPQ